MNIVRGDVWIVDLGEGGQGEAAYTRPAVVVSCDGFNSSRAPTVTIVPGTSTQRGLAVHLVVPPGESGLSKTTVFQPEQILTIHRAALHKRVGRLGVARMSELSARLQSYLDLR